MKIQVIRSARRRKTVQARLVGGTLRISIPDRLTPEEEALWVERMTARVARRSRSDRLDLPVRTRRLARQLDLPEPATVAWSDRQHTRWGSCTPVSGEVRISRRLADFPDWVVDYVIVHELAHLVEASHSDAFWRLANRYPLAERARGYLIGRDHATDAAGVPADFPSPVGSA